GEMRPRDGERALELPAARLELPAQRAKVGEAYLDRAQACTEPPETDSDQRQRRQPDREHARRIIPLTRGRRHDERCAMRAIRIDTTGGTPSLVVADVPPPAMGPADVRIRVRATAGNRADLMQVRGFYPPPPGASDILGLECAGEVIDVGAAAQGVTRGTRVMALLAGGGYAEEACVHHGSILPTPDTFSDTEAGAFPEVFLTASSN